MRIVDHIRQRAADAPNHAALVENDRAGSAVSTSYSELVERFEGVAARLRAEGIVAGDRCGLLAKPGRGFIELALGILAADGCLVPIPDDHQGPILDEFIANARLQRLLVESPDAESPFEHRRLEPGIETDSTEDAFRALQPAYLRFTSGTTSLRKGVILGHETIEQRLIAANRALQIGGEDRVLWLLPMAHHFVVSILLYLRNGATILMPASPLAREVLEFCARALPTVSYASPHHYKLLSKDASELGLATLRLAVSTAEGLRAEIAAAFLERFGRPLAQALGIIEVGLPVVNLDAASAKPTALGKPLPDYDVWLRDEDGKRLESSSPDNTGEICIAGPGLLDAYLDPWLPAEEILEPDGFRTGDQGWFDADGDLHLEGRRATRICMAGMKFFGEEVERALDLHTAIRESRVFAVEHAHLGEIPCAEIVPALADQPPERKELVRHCREYLPAYKIPREFRVVEELQRTDTGKIRRG